jgi:hypothetical protein
MRSTGLESLQQREERAGVLLEKITLKAYVASTMIMNTIFKYRVF